MATPGLPSQVISALYSNHHRWLQSWLRRRLGCSSDAADLAHDTYERLMKADRQPNTQEPRGWLMQIAKGLVVDLHRRRRLELAYLEWLATQAERSAPSAEGREIALETLIQIDSILDGMPAKPREAFFLSRFERLTYPQIAERLNVSVASVQKYMLAAVQACYIALYPEHAPSR
jgi:RNA polymerase sigma factor (sigma-70 family)